MTSTISSFVKVSQKYIERFNTEFLNSNVQSLKLGQIKELFFKISHSIIEYCRPTQKNNAAIVIQRAWRAHFRRHLKDKKLTYEKWQVQKIQQNRCPKWHDELQRLKLKKINPQSWLQHVPAIPHELRLNVEFNVLIGRALEIKEKYKDSHFVFTHAQSHLWATTSELITALFKRIDVKSDYDLCTIFRQPVEKRINVKGYLEKKPLINDSSERHGRELLSVDAHIWSYKSWESALYFLLSKSNVKSTTETIVFNTIYPHIAGYLLKSRVTNEILAIARRRQLESKIGTLFLICIPKKMVENPETNIAYRSLPYGIPLPQLAQTKEIQILEKLQDDRFACSGITNKIFQKLSFWITGKQMNLPTKIEQHQVPQYRILAEQIRPSDGCRSFCVTAISERRLKSYKQEIDAIVEKILSKKVKPQNLIEQVDSTFESLKNKIFSWLS